MHFGSLPFDYLGVPLFMGAPKRKWLQHVADRILAKFVKWKGDTLSQAGRLVLIKSVICSSLLHSFAVYKWPMNLLKHMEKHMCNFLWSGSTAARKLVSLK